MKGLLIIGASGHGRVVADIAEKTNKYGRICFLDDNEALVGKEFAGRNVVGTSDYVRENAGEYEVFVAIGNNETRRIVMERLEGMHAAIPILVHPSAVVADDVRMGSGCVIMAGAVINSGASLGKGVIVNTSSSVDHDCRVGDFVHISVGAHVAGTVCIGKGTWVGAGATISNNLMVTDGVVLGAGAVLVNDIKSTGTYVGVPAKRMHAEEEES